MSFTAVALLAPWLAVAGQQDTLAAIDGTVISSFNGHALSGVMIAVPAVRRFVVTDSTGTFALRRLPAGKQRIRISYVERGSEEYVVALHPGKTTRLAVLLDIEAVDLAPVVVEGRGGSFDRSLAGFYDRRERSFGTFYTLEDIERIHPYRLSSLLRYSGISVRCRGAECMPYTWKRSRLCPMGLYLDGMPTDAAFLDAIHPDQVAAVEIYRRGSNVPFEFVGRSSDCGLVAVWSRI